MHIFDSNVKGVGWGEELHFGMYNKEVFRRKFN